MNIFHDPTFWVAISLLIFVALVYRPIAKALPKALDARADKIRAEIEEAEKLRAEAQDLLAQYQRQQREVAAEAETVVRRAREETNRMAEEGHARLEAALKRREKTALERIRRAEEQAMATVRARTVDLAIAAARTLLAERLTAAKGDALIDQAIKELPAKLH
ncbi:MAG: F0F1 ATP synthase subunit B [Rhodospirillales bacterium]|nr:F0F1 ATP synthase subunit B [Rhodospirillales bacterium]MSP80885.1 F0F1 ATP synthase subunit B [Rhodospirillales bacterium]